MDFSGSYKEPGVLVRELTYFDHLIILMTNWGALLFLAGLAIALYGLLILMRAFQTGRPQASWERVAGGILLIAGGLLWSYLQTLVPTRYAANPVPRMSGEQVAALAAPIYSQHCAVCHGETGQGDGPLSAFVTPPPANFAIHGWHHREGEHYWWITRGIPGTSMPSFGDFLSEEERWLLARYVKQLGREARLP